MGKLALSIRVNGGKPLGPSGLPVLPELSRAGVCQPEESRANSSPRHA
jgi:hypothetical protein